MAIRSPQRACARARVAPQIREYMVAPGHEHAVDVRAALPVLELAYVVVAGDAVDPLDALPAQEDVGRRLHQPLTGTTRSPWCA